MEIEEMTNMRRSERNIVENRVQVVAHKNVYVYREYELLLHGKLQVGLIGRRVQRTEETQVDYGTKAGRKIDRPNIHAFSSRDAPS